MTPAQLLPVLLAMLALAPLIAGIVLGVRHRSRHPRASNLLIAGCALLVVATVLGAVTPILVAVLIADDRDVTDIGLILTGVGSLSTLSGAGGIALLVAAVLADRNHQPMPSFYGHPASVPGPVPDSPGQPMWPGRPGQPGQPGQSGPPVQPGQPTRDDRPAPPFAPPDGHRSA